MFVYIYYFSYTYKTVYIKMMATIFMDKIIILPDYSQITLLEFIQPNSMHNY